MGRAIQVGASLRQGDRNAGRGRVDKSIVVLSVGVGLRREGETVEPRVRIRCNLPDSDGQVTMRVGDWVKTVSVEADTGRITVK